MSSRIGIDVGGTFTDLIFLDEETGQVTVGKGPTVPGAVDEGVRAVVRDAVGAEGLGRSEYFLHGTTVGLNALLERRGAKVGVLATEGFRDTLEIRRLLRSDERGERVWDLMFRVPEPLVPRELRLGVGGRIMADGSEHAALDEEAIRAAAATFTAHDVECVAVAFINAHANPAHEVRAAEVLREGGFTGALSLSHQVTGEFREYERTSTTVIDAYVRPTVSGYLDRLESGLREGDFDGDCLITTSSGGCVAFSEAQSRPFQTVMSGPVAGAVGSGVLCRQLGIDLAVTADVGGTSFDTCLLVDGHPQIKYEGEVVGMPLQTPWVDVRSVGAGGGSIAYADGGLLHVGPRSAGADPGPVCYQKGGTEPTVTDAAVVLGMFGRTELASGLELDAEGARAAVERLAGELGLDTDETARGILRVVSAGMAGAIRAVSVEVGEDPRRGALLAYGGAGPLFAGLLARELQIRTVVVPNFAGNFSAWGLLAQDVVRASALTIVAPLDDDGLGRASDATVDLLRRLEEAEHDAIGGEQRREAALDLRYLGQEYTVTIPVTLDDGRRITDSAADVDARFGVAYERSYGHRIDAPVEIVSVRAFERTELPRPSDTTGGSSNVATGAGEAASVRAYSFARDDWHDFAVVDRAALAPGDTFAGPAIVLETTTTTYVDDGFSAVVHDTGALLITDDTQTR